MAATAEAVSTIRSAVQQLGERYRDWVRDQTQEDVSQGLYDAMQFCVQVAEVPTDDYQDQRIVLAIDRAAAEWKKWIDEYVPLGAKDIRSRVGHRGLWLAVEYLLEQEANPFRFRTLETIEHLRRSKVPPRQIARIYEWFTSKGEPDLTKVMEEFAKPGTHVPQGEPYRLPSDVAMVEAIREAYEARQAVADQRAQATAAPSSVAAEPLDDLIYQKVTCKQIQKMKGLSRAEILHRAGELGIMLPDEPNAAAYKGPPTRVELQEQEDEAAQENFDRDRRLDQVGTTDAGTLEDNVMAMWGDKLTATEIVDVLSAQWPDLTPQRVMEIVKQAGG